MKIVVAFKVVPEYDKISKKDLLKGDFYIGKNGFGFFDEGALELALRMSSNLEALTFSSVDEIFIEKLYSVGFNKVTVLKGKNTDFSPKETARVLSDYLKTINYDLILFGNMVGPNDSGMVPYYVSQNLNVKIVPDVTYIENIDGKCLVYSEDENSTKTYEINSKAILIVGNSRYSYLRFAKFSELEKNKGRKADEISIKAKKSIPLLFGKKEIKKATKYISIYELKNLLEGKDD